MIPSVPSQSSQEKKFSNGKFLCSLLESQRLQPRKLKLLLVAGKALAVVRVVDVETLVEAVAVAVAAEAVEVVEAAAYVFPGCISSIDSSV